MSKGNIPFIADFDCGAVLCLCPYQAAQQSLRLEQLAQLHNIPIHQITRERTDSLPSSSLSTGEVQRLQKELKELQAERVEKQAEMDRLERELKREKGTA